MGCHIYLKNARPFPADWGEKLRLITEDQKSHQTPLYDHWNWSFIPMRYRAGLNKMYASGVHFTDIHMGAFFSLPDATRIELAPYSDKEVQKTYGNVMRNARKVAMTHFTKRRYKKLGRVMMPCILFHQYHFNIRIYPQQYGREFKTRQELADYLQWLRVTHVDNPTLTEWYAPERTDWILDLWEDGNTVCYLS